MALIVDDDLELREKISVDFKRKGFGVFTAANGIDAFELVINNHIDLIISDIKMSICDGICLLTKIKSISLIFPIFIFISGVSNYTKEQLEEKGAYDLLAKPIDRKIMFDVLEQALTI